METLLYIYKERDDLKEYFDNCYGYAFFPTVGKAGGFMIGGSIGKGSVYVNKTIDTGLPFASIKVGTTTLIQLSFGFQLGGQVYSQIIFFETQRDYNYFCSSGGNFFEFGADANAVALTASASTKASTLGNQPIRSGLYNDTQQELLTKSSSSKTTPKTKYTKGMAVFTAIAGGLMYEASISGQKFLPVVKVTTTTDDKGGPTTTKTSEPAPPTETTPLSASASSSALSADYYDDTTKVVDTDASAVLVVGSVDDNNNVDDDAVIVEEPSAEVPATTAERK